MAAAKPVQPSFRYYLGGYFIAKSLFSDDLAKKLTLTEIPAPGRPKHLGLKKHHAYTYDMKNYVTIPKNIAIMLNKTTK